MRVLWLGAFVKALRVGPGGRSFETRPRPVAPFGTSSGDGEAYDFWGPVPESYEFMEALGEGESFTREFKSCAHDPALKIVKDKVFKYVNAFTNSGGGEVLFGVDDDGRVSGCRLSASEVVQCTRLIDGATQRVDPMLDVDAVRAFYVPVVGGPTTELFVVAVRVRRGSREPVYFAGADSDEAWIRRAESVHAMTPQLVASRENDFKAAGRPVTRTWRHVAARGLPFLEHAVALREAAGDRVVASSRRWFWRDLLRKVQGGPDGNLVVVQGGSGTGKSTLLASLALSQKLPTRGPGGAPAKRLGSRRGRTAGVGVAGAHFCLGHARETTSVEVFVHNLAAALTTAPLTRAFKAEVVVPSPLEVLRVTEQPDKANAMRALFSLLKTVEGPAGDRGNRVVFVVDGLDEGVGDDGGLTIPALLAETAREAPEWLAFVVSTRPGEALDALEVAPRTTIDLDGDRSLGDVALYARRRLAPTPEEEEEDDDDDLDAFERGRVEMDLGRKLAKASKGSFQFARAVLDLVDDSSASSAAALVRILGDADKTLHRLYDEIFATHFEGRYALEDARPVLEVLLASPRALSVEEVVAAVDPFHPDVDAKRVLSDLRPFLASKRVDESDTRLSLHASLREWLVGDTPFGCAKGRGHALMAAHHLRRVHAATVRQHPLLRSAAADAVDVERNQETVFHVLEAASHLATRDASSSGGTLDESAEALRGLCGADALRAADSQGRTAVHFAAKHATKTVRALRLLLLASGDVETAAESPAALRKTRDGKTPLFLAASRGRVDAVAALLEACDARAARDRAAKCGTCDADPAAAPSASCATLVEASRQALLVAAASGSATCVRLLLARGLETPRQDLDVAVAAALRQGLQDGDTSALMVATKRANVDAAASLCAYATVEDVDDCLREASARGSEALVALFLDAGGDPLGSRRPAGVASPDDRMPCLNRAARHGHAFAARALLRRPDSRVACLQLGDDWGRTPLHEAVYHLRLDVVHVLLSTATNSNVDLFAATDLDGATPLHVAAYWSKARASKANAMAKADKILECLLSNLPRGVAVLDAEDADGASPLERAARADGDQLVWVARFLNAGAAVPPEAHAVAARKGNDRVARLLRDQQREGDDARERPDDADDVWRAARRGDLGTVRAKLATQPGLANVPDASRRTPLHYAAQAGNVDLIRLLLSYGARDDDGTARHTAATAEARFVLRTRPSDSESAPDANATGTTALDAATEPGGAAF